MRPQAELGDESDRSLRSVRLWKIQIAVGDVWDSDDQHAHSAACAVDDSRWNVNQGSFANRMLVAVEEDRPFAVEHVVKFRGDFVIVLFGAVNIDGVRPGGDVVILPAHQQVPPATSAAL